MVALLNELSAINKELRQLIAEQQALLTAVPYGRRATDTAPPAEVPND
jgi:hypothetical protein